MAASLGISSDWACLHQVHGSRVLRVDTPGMAGDADAMFTTRPMLPLAVGTADCLPVVIEGEGGVGIAHVGWRGAAGGVISALREALAGAGILARRAAVGPGIGPCCFEVGPEVVAAFPGWEASTRGGSQSVDLPSAVASSLEGLEVWRASVCTYCGSGFRSQRRDGTSDRQVALAWLTSG
jgi:YfiH family protein